jgi:hypothetical protein
LGAYSHLSDKKEALDVVEDKLNQALAKVRPSEGFPNPILRLGKDASNYAQLLKKSAIERLQVNQRVVRQKRPEREIALKSERNTLTAGLEATAAAYAQIDLREIAELERATADLIAIAPHAKTVLADARLADLTHAFGVVAHHVRSLPNLATLLRSQGSSPKRLLEISRVCATLTSCDVAASDLAAIKSFSLEKLTTLNSVIEQIEALRVSVFGYLFAGKGLQKAAKILRDECKIETDKPHRQLSKLKSLRKHFNNVRDHLAANGIEAEFGAAIFLILTDLAGTGKKPIAPAEVLNSTQKLEEAMSLSTPLLVGAKGGFYRAMLEANEGSLSLVNRLADLKVRESLINARFLAVPKLNYIDAKARIESLNTQHLAERIDERLIEFHDNKRNDAMALGKIIREKQRFPIDKFADIQRAFPCIIAGLRDYAEFIPLERELFDLVIIDEASQVSIAQALPAIIRAKKILVLGDRNQFGNVKTSNASKEVN